MRLFKLSLLIIVSIAVLGTGAFLFWYQWQSLSTAGRTVGDQPLTADELVERVIQTQKMTTNLLDGGLIRAQFAIQTDSPKTKSRLEKTMFQVESAIIKILSQQSQEKLTGGQGLPRVEQAIRQQLNELLEGEKVVKVYTVDWVIQ